MIQEINQIEEIDLVHIEPLVLEHLQFHVDHLKILVVIMIE